ncbi:MAG: hypothetical protein V4671_13520 [Armatimonadota bacterium]
MSLWDNEESERQQRTQRILIIVGAVAATLIVFWVFRNAISIASQPANGVGFASSGRARQLINGMDSDGSARPPQTSTPPNPGSPLGGGTRFVAPVAPAYVPPPPPPLVGGAYAPPPFVAPTLPELSPEERAQAKAATVPLRQTLQAVRDFDRKSFWNTGASGNAGNSVGEAESAVDALGAMVALNGHPDRFPTAMRGIAANAATGIRSYLRLTMDAAETNDPAERQRLRPAAEKRLAEADAAIVRLEGTNPNNGFAPGIAAN